MDKLKPLTKISKIVAPKPMKKAAVPAPKSAAGKLGALLGQKQAPSKPRSDSNIFEGNPSETAIQAIDFLLENKAISFTD